MIFGQVPCAESSAGVAQYATRRVSLALMVLVLFVLAGCGGGGGGSSDSSSTVNTSPATITGRVVDAGSQPVANAGVPNVRITGTFTATTDSNGNFTATVPAGTSAGTINLNPPTDSNGNSQYQVVAPVQLVYRNSSGTTDSTAVGGKTYNIGNVVIRNSSSPPPPPF